MDIAKIEYNTGQIEGVPKNPRFIRDEKFRRLVKSIQDDPEMMELREVIVYDMGDGRLVDVMGNMRLRALRELKEKQAWVKVLPTGTPASKIRAFVLKDNSNFGEYDMDELANNWEIEEIDAAGINFDFNADDFSEKNKEIDPNFDGAKFMFKLEYSESEYMMLKEKIERSGKKAETIFYEALK